MVKSWNVILNPINHSSLRKSIICKTSILYPHLTLTLCKQKCGKNKKFNIQLFKKIVQKIVKIKTSI